MSSETLKCCRLCGAFLTCDHKGECCPECSYFDEKDYLCLAPEQMKKAVKSKKVKTETEEETSFDDDEVDPETFLFEDDEDDELDDFDDEDEDDEFDDDFAFDDDWD